MTYLLSLTFSLSFGVVITCKTGKYPGQKSDLMTVTVKYGKNTTKDVPSAYQYSENPKVTDYSPKASFLWWGYFLILLACCTCAAPKNRNRNWVSYPCVCSGGRKIVVSGSGFDLIQKATMKVLPVNAGPEVGQEVTVKQGWETQMSLSFIHLLYSVPLSLLRRLWVRTTQSCSSTLQRWTAPATSRPCRRFSSWTTWWRNWRTSTITPTPRSTSSRRTSSRRPASSSLRWGHALTFTVRLIRFCDLTLWFRSGSRFRQSHNGQWSAGVRRGRLLSREHLAGMSTSVTSAAGLFLCWAKRVSSLRLFRRISWSWRLHCSSPCPDQSASGETPPTRCWSLW